MIRRFPIKPVLSRKVQLIFCSRSDRRRFSTDNVPNNVSESAIQEFQDNGVVILRNIFNSDWVEIVIRGIKTSIQNPSEFSDCLRNTDGTGLFFNDYCKWAAIEEFRNYVYKSPAAELAGRLMRSTKSMFFHEHVFVKEGGSQKQTPWHQDQPYYGVDGFQNCSLWMPLTPVKKESSLRFIKGSHLWKNAFVPKKFATFKDYEVAKGETDSEFQSLDSVQGDTLETSEVLSWDVEPGDCIAFHMKTLHGTSDTISSVSRMVLATRWLGDDCTVADRPWPTSPPKEAFSSKLIPGQLVSNVESFPIIWEDPRSKT